jgi:hypothetical protein
LRLLILALGRKKADGWNTTKVCFAMKVEGGDKLTDVHAGAHLGTLAASPSDTSQDCLPKSSIFFL